jgi:hypothetical protein
MSFIHEEERVASVVNSFIPLILGQTVNTFMSSDKNAIYAGEDWMKRIFKELRTAKVLISMLSPDSVKRPWINFEAGAAWMRNAKVIPVCFGGLTIDRLPKPYSSLQAVEIETHQGAHYLFSSIAHHFDLSLPKMPIFSDNLPSDWTDAQKTDNGLRVSTYTSLNLFLKIAWRDIQSKRNQSL